LTGIIDDFLREQAKARDAWCTLHRVYLADHDYLFMLISQ
jgi:hypothetical protein